ncbi:hypothetical protein GCM10025871_29710 [Deinococcus metallilatus]|nr:hypothetical protein GCM10025871_29710 [Deinococcus metallilatus]
MFPRPAYNQVLVLQTQAPLGNGVWEAPAPPGGSAGRVRRGDSFALKQAILAPQGRFAQERERESQGYRKVTESAQLG